MFFLHFDHLLFRISYRICGELYKQRSIIRDISLECRLVSVYLAAFLTFVDYYIPLPRVGLNGDRLHCTQTVVCTIAGHYVNVK